MLCQLIEKGKELWNEKVQPWGQEKWEGFQENREERRERRNSRRNLVGVDHLLYLNKLVMPSREYWEWFQDSE